MIEFKYCELEGGHIMRALSSLCRKQTNNKLAYDLSKLYLAMEAAAKGIQKEYQGLLRQFVELDEKGDIKIKEKTQAEYLVLPGKQEELNEKLRGFAETVLKIDRSKIALSRLEAVTLSGEEMLHLAPLIEDDLTKPPLKIA